MGWAAGLLRRDALFAFLSNPFFVLRAFLVREKRRKEIERGGEGGVGGAISSCNILILLYKGKHFIYFVMTSAKPVHALYRDCLRVVRLNAGANSPKAMKLRAIVAGEFRKNANVKDPEKVEALKFNAVRALSNYLVYESMADKARKKE